MLYAGIGVVVLVVLFLVFRALGSDDKREIADRQDPQKHWAQAAQAIYQGNGGDAGYFASNGAINNLSKGWDIKSREDLVNLIDTYGSGETNVGFDKLRMIWLARLGFAAGWLDEATSWKYVFSAKSAIQNAYTSWTELRDAMVAGRAEWYGGADQVPDSQVESAKENFQYASQKFFPNVMFR
jgi:hypothetical protein